MVKEEKENISGFRTVLRRLMAVFMLLTLILTLASPGSAYAAKEKDKENEEPIREVHNVGVGGEVYCFFVTHNVVLTPAELEEMSDEELTAAIIDRAGLYMKKANCRKANHKEISVKSWEKKNGGFYLSGSDIEEMRAAEPVDGEPVKFYMDLLIVTDRAAYEKSKESKEKEGGEEAGGPENPEDAEDTEDIEDAEEEEVPVYSTYKKTSPRLLFAVVATEEDAKYGEDICVEDKKPGKKQKTTTPRIEEPDEPEGDMLPEYRTINMADRSGAPIEETLEDGSPVDLEWIDPKDINKDEGSSFLDKIPGGVTGLAVMAAATAAVIAGIIVAAKRRRESEK